jgi:hypothetical protein
MDISLNGGILVVGSLLWDRKPHRVDWRNNCLQIDNQILVKAPIRYGRVSQTRNCIFTMVFSDECNAVNLQGEAVFLPFSNNPVNLEKLNHQSIELIKAEYRNVKEHALSKFYWDWGALSLCINPEILKDTSEKNASAKLLQGYWASKYDGEFNPDYYKLGKESPIINDKGVLKYIWPSQLNNYDFMVSTLTRPNKEYYPTAKNIVDRMIINEDKEYFTKNMICGIKTFQDEEIKSLLKNS